MPGLGISWPLSLQKGTKEIFSKYIHQTDLSITHAKKNREAGKPNVFKSSASWFSEGSFCANQILYMWGPTSIYKEFLSCIPSGGFWGVF